jgi:pimeloyl-ACP methyl ester carboxylesterase
MPRKTAQPIAERPGRDIARGCHHLAGWLTIWLCLLLVAALPGAASPAGEEVSFQAADGVRVYADLFLGPKGVDGPLILLFHQAGGDGRGEYGPIVPRLLEDGYSALVVDQRNGGDRFGGVNRTLAGLEGDEPGYCAAYPDLVAALDFAQARGFHGPIVAWGSSYSAALVLRLAADKGSHLAAVLAFSPAAGPAMGECSADAFADAVDIPVLALRPAREMSDANARQGLERLARAGAQTEVVEHAVHGSSMLVAERVKGDVEGTWKIVLDFLHEHAAP